MPSKPERKLGRNDRCWCGSGKKYKNCHLPQDEEAARVSAPVAPTPSAKSIGPYAPLDLPKPRELSPEQQAEQVEWHRFGAADLDGKIAFFLTRLENKNLDTADAFEAYLAIRDAADPRHDVTARTRLVELMEHLRRDAPEAYNHSAIYLKDLAAFAVTEKRWDALPDLLAEFAEIADKRPDEFYSVTEMLLYHGQTQPLFAAMKSAWHKVSQSERIFDWGVNEYYGTLVELCVYRYLETAPQPRADDPGLLEALGALGGKPNQNWLALAIEHLSASAPSPWRAEDFGAAVDADNWDHNIVALLFDWMADQHRRAGVPFSKSDLFKEEMQRVLHQQISERAPESKRKHGKSKRAAGPAAGSPLIPRYDLLERARGQVSISQQ